MSVVVNVMRTNLSYTITYETPRGGAFLDDLGYSHDSGHRVPTHLSRLVFGCLK